MRDAEESAYQSRSESDAPTVRPRKRKSVNRDGAAGAPVDPVLPEKKRARRRLVGAVALVLAVVIGLPMVLDSEPKPLAEDITIEIPSKDRPQSRDKSSGKAAAQRDGASASGAGSGGASTSRVPAAAALDQKEEVIEPPLPAVAAAVAAAGKPRPEVSPKATAAKPSESADKPAAEKTTADRSSGDRSAADKAPADKTSADKSVAEKSAAEKSTPEPGTDSKPVKFTLQVAAFASIDKVNDVRGKLKDAGITSYTQKVATDNGERIRIRVGPLNSKQEVDRMRAKLAAMGLNGTLVAPS